MQEGIQSQCISGAMSILVIAEHASDVINMLRWLAVMVDMQFVEGPFLHHAYSLLTAPSADPSQRAAAAKCLMAGEALCVQMLPPASLQTPKVAAYIVAQTVFNQPKSSQYM